jgi:glucose-6-phosphate 1-dehydrogenase
VGDVIIVRLVAFNLHYFINLQEESCFDELKDMINDKFPEMKSVYLAMPITCFREIAEKLPCSKDEMMQIDQV